MRNVPVIILLTFFAQTHAQEHPEGDGKGYQAGLLNYKRIPRRLLSKNHAAENSVLNLGETKSKPGENLNRVASRIWDPPLPSLGGGTWNLEKGKKVEKMTAVGIAKGVFNLIKNIVGKGVLSLPAGVAAIGGDRALLLPATLLLTAMGAFSAYTFYLYGRQMSAHDVTSISKVWTRTVGRNSLIVVKLINVVYPLLGCLAYSLILGDSFSALATGGVFGKAVVSSKIATDRRTWIIGLTLAVLYPLCQLRKFGALSYTSLLGTMAVGYNAVFLILRCLDGSYAKGGDFYDDLAVKPKFGGGPLDFPGALKTFFTKFGSFVFLSMCEVAFICHQNAPSYYEQAGHDLSTYGLITGLGFGIAILFNIVFLFSGYLTFGSSSAGMILNSYALTDRLAAVARVLISCSILCSYPLVFNGLKLVSTETLTTRFKGIKDGALLNQAITLVAMAAITTVACSFDNIGVANAITGAVTGSALIYILPTLMYLKSPLPKVKLPIEKVVNVVLLTFGSLMTFLGSYASLSDPPPEAPPAPK